MRSDRRVILHIRRRCPRAPASARCAMRAAYSPDAPGIGIPLATGEEETRVHARVTRLEAVRQA